MARSTSIYLDQETDQALYERTKENRSRSETITTIVRRYAELCRRDQPQLEVNEWKMVCDILNGIWLNDSASLSYVWAEVADACQLNHTDKKWEVDGAALVNKLRALTYGQLVALVDEVERFWFHTDDPGYALPGEKADDA